MGANYCACANCKAIFSDAGIYYVCQNCWEYFCEKCGDCILDEDDEVSEEGKEECIYCTTNSISRVVSDKDLLDFLIKKLDLNYSELVQEYIKKQD